MISMIIISCSRDQFFLWARSLRVDYRKYRLDCWNESMAVGVVSEMAFEAYSLRVRTPRKCPGAIMIA